MANLEPITEKNHPIEKKWLIKNFIFYCIMITITLILFPRSASVKTRYVFQSIIILIMITGWIVYLILAVKNYHYNFGEKLITLKQGVISKSERSIPYGRIQNISLNQGFIDRLLGLASISIETASEGGGVKLVVKNKDKSSSLFNILPGFFSNTIGIPGLSYENAVNLKDTLAKLIKENPIDDAQSGL